VGPILNGCGKTGVFKCRQRLPVNRESRITLRDLQSAATGTVSRSCNSQIANRNSQLALFTTERQHDLGKVVPFSKTCLQHRPV